MAVATEELIHRVLLRNISWSTYEAILADLAERPIRLTYDRGDLEIMAPSKRHERHARLIDRMIGALTEELGVPLQSTGATTWRSALKGRGLEADESYYLQNEHRVRGELDFDPERHPLPDLAVEVEVSRSLLDRQSLYAALGIGEIWRFDGERLTALVLEGDGYSEVEFSRALPFLRVQELSLWLRKARETDETTWIRSFRRWVRTSFPSARRGDSG